MGQVFGRGPSVDRGRAAFLSCPAAVFVSVGGRTFFCLPAASPKPCVPCPSHSLHSSSDLLGQRPCAVGLKLPSGSYFVQPSYAERPLCNSVMSLSIELAGNTHGNVHWTRCSRTGSALRTSGCSAVQSLRLIKWQLISKGSHVCGIKQQAHLMRQQAHNTTPLHCNQCHEDSDTPTQHNALLKMPQSSPFQHPPSGTPAPSHQTRKPGLAVLCVQSLCCLQMQPPGRAAHTASCCHLTP